MNRQTPAEGALRLSVIVPAHNGGAALRTCLDALAASGRPHDEIIVADDASSDGSTEEVEARGVRVIRVGGGVGPGPCGPAAARNQAAAAASGDVLIFVDADVAVHPDTLGRFEAGFVRDPDVAAIFGSYDDAPPGDGVPSRYKNLLHHFVHHRGGRRDAGTFWAGCGAVRRAAFLEVGGFDDQSYPRPSIEDIELGVRLRDAGRRIVLDPEIQATHLKRWTLANLIRTDIFARAAPWTRLLARRKAAPPRELNLDTGSRLSAAVVLLATLCLFVGVFFPIAWAGVPVALLTVLALNADLFRFLYRCGGAGFLPGALALHALYLLYGSITYVLVTLLVRWEQHYEATDRRQGGRLTGWVLTFYLSFFLLSHGGRIGTVDAWAQLQATTVLATTGRLGAPAPPGKQLWFRNPRDGLFYENHDIGAIGLMLPSAWLGATLSAASPWQDAVDPPPLSRVGVAFSYTLLAALGCLYTFRLWALVVPPRPAFLLSLVFATATIYWPYSKYSFDVIAGSALTCVVLYYSARLLADPEPARGTALKLGIALALATAFRFYFGPVLLIGLAGTLLYAWRRLSPGHLARCLVPFALSLALGLWYNALRTGNPLRSGAMGQHLPVSALRPTFWPGLYGLLLSPNRGLLVFAPVFLLLFALPFVWKRTAASPVRLLLPPYGLAAVLYTLVIARLSFWGSFGWGPRYLVPVLPLLFLGVGLALVALWPGGRHRGWLAALIGVSVLLNAAPVLVNWSLAVSGHPEAPRANSPRPYQHIVVWRGLVSGLRGEPLPAPAEFTDDPVRNGTARFPDLWLVRAWEQPSWLTRAGALFAGFLLLSLCVSSLTRLLRRESGPPAAFGDGVSEGVSENLSEKREVA